MLKKKQELKSHKEITEKLLLQFARTLNKFLSGISEPRQKNKFYSENAEIITLASSYLFSLAKNHAFLDVNKRISLAVTNIFLDINGYILPTSEKELEDFVIKVSSDKNITIHEIEQFLSINVKSI